MKVWSSSLIKLVVPLPDLLSLPGAEARIILALRLAIASHKLGKDARNELGIQLGSDRAAGRLLILMESMGSAWPETFMAGRTCCPCTTSDEILLLKMMRHAASGNRPAFDLLVCEMIGDCSRNRIFFDIENFISIYRAQPIN